MSRQETTGKATVSTNQGLPTKEPSQGCIEQLRQTYGNDEEVAKHLTEEGYNAFDDAGVDFSKFDDAGVDLNKFLKAVFDCPEIERAWPVMDEATKSRIAKGLASTVIHAMGADLTERCHLNRKEHFLENCIRSIFLTSLPTK